MSPAHPTPAAAEKIHPVPHFTGTLGMIWFISGLGMLFGAAMLGYLAMRIGRSDELHVGSLHLPRALWLSTALVLLASAAIQAAVRSIRRERQDRMRAWLLTTLILGVLFCLVQVPSLTQLIHEHMVERARHAQALAADPNLAAALAMNPIDTPAGAKLPRLQPFFGMIFVFILIHAAHVAGGIVQLVAVTRGAFRGRYDHEYYNPVKHAAMYWHFLDVVWLIMFGTMSVLG